MFSVKMGPGQNFDSNPYVTWYMDYRNPEKLYEYSKPLIISGFIQNYRKYFNFLSLLRSLVAMAQFVRYVRANFVWFLIV